VRTNTKNIPILLLSSKQDLIEEGHPMAVGDAEIDGFVAMNKMNGYLRVSSKSGLNVAESFTQISELMIEKNMNK
jgi:hypothetical protein